MFMNTHETRRQKGLCPYCGKTPIPNRRKCQECTDKYVGYKKKYLSKMSSSRCKTCGGNRDDKHKTCSVCRERIKEWRKINLSNGKCECGRDRIENSNSKQCQTCYLKATAQQSVGSTKRHQELLELFEDQNGICPYSGRKMTLGVDTAIDHKIPKSKGGTNEIGNLQWTHRVVNQMKWDTYESDFLNLINEISSYRKFLE
jgi:hypothetical protein